MSNNFSCVGNLGKDAEMREAGSSVVCGFSVGDSVGFGDKKSTNWWNCQLWGKRGEALSQYLTKGTKVFIAGEVTMRKYTDKEGNERYSQDVNVNQVQLLGGGEQQESSASEPAPPTPATDADMPF